MVKNLEHSPMRISKIYGILNGTFPCLLAEALKWRKIDAKCPEHSKKKDARSSTQGLLGKCEAHFATFSLHVPSGNDMAELIKKDWRTEMPWRHFSRVLCIFFSFPKNGERSYCLHTKSHLTLWDPMDRSEGAHV